MNEHDPLLAISPIDGRYASKVNELAPVVSEYGLIHTRAEVMTRWFAHLNSGVLPDVEPLPESAQQQLEGIINDFDTTDAQRVKEIEKETNHDVKAVELWLKEKMPHDEAFTNRLELIHFGCTSEDVNNIAHALMMKRADVIWGASEDRIVETLNDMADTYAELPMLSLTHGQPATPTTFGKEMKVFSQRLQRSRGEIEPLGKTSGATGNYAAMTFAYPEVDWQQINRQFVESFDIEFNEHTTQIEAHDWIVRRFGDIALINSIKIDLARDMWGYISRGVLAQKTKAGETGSSTMPHKVNPIDFENAEGNFDIANSIASGLRNRLPISRFQRDLSDSTTMRNLGMVYGYSLLANKSLSKGLSKVHPNETVLAGELDQNYAVLTEAVQTVMRREGVKDAYMHIKEASRGKEIGKESYLELVESLTISETAKQSLRVLKPSEYVGLSAELARSDSVTDY